MAPRHTLSADERLKREQSIQTLFRSGKAFSVFPVRAIWRIVPRVEGEKEAIRCGFSAAKKKFRKATQRARVKRLLREAWRQQKHQLQGYITAEDQLHIFLLCTAAELPEWTAIQGAVQEIIQKLAAALSPSDSTTPPIQ